MPSSVVASTTGAMCVGVGLGADVAVGVAVGAGDEGDVDGGALVAMAGVSVDCVVPPRLHAIEVKTNSVINK